MCIPRASCQDLFSRLGFETWKFVLYSSFHSTAISSLRTYEIRFAPLNWNRQCSPHLFFWTHPEVLAGHVVPGMEFSVSHMQGQCSVTKSHPCQPAHMKWSFVNTEGDSGSQRRGRMLTSRSTSLDVLIQQPNEVDIIIPFFQMKKQLRVNNLSNFYNVAELRFIYLKSLSTLYTPFTRW